MLSVVLGLLGNKWIAGGLAAVGVLIAVWVTAYTKGYNASNVEHWKAVAAAEQRASAKKDEIREADLKAMNEARDENEHLNSELEAIRAKANATPDACVLTDGELRSLRDIAGGHASSSQRGRTMPTAPGRSPGRSQPSTNH